MHRSHAQNGAGADGLRGRFHSHLTVAMPDSASLERLRAFCAARKVKLTVIDLADFQERAQRDVMTTCYHRSEAPNALQVVLDEVEALRLALEAEGFEVLRAKLEHESLPTLSQLSEERYRETHIKLALSEAALEAEMSALASMAPDWGFVLSRNPNERRADRVHQFLNLRAYAGSREQADARTQALVEALQARGFEVLEVKRETTVLDTRREHDRWWA
ncbi:MAG: hypothetical protein H6740_13840 [Alphaproteobacteria bacterium]|nr:hypothetical protein [Alphaproteobacteria bacterium]